MLTDIDDKILRSLQKPAFPGGHGLSAMNVNLLRPITSSGVLDPTLRTACDRTYSRTDCSHSAFGGSWPRIQRRRRKRLLLGGLKGSLLTHQRLEDMRTTEARPQIDSATEAGKKDRVTLPCGKPQTRGNLQPLRGICPGEGDVQVGTEVRDVLPLLG